MNKKEYFISKQIRIIKLNLLHFIGKDLIELDSFDDFIYLMDEADIVYLFDNNYYLIADGIAWYIKND